LISCVHIIQLKVLTCIRVGNRQKKIDISIPRLDTFVHKVYIQVARKVYSNVYLFEKGITPLQQQKNMREFEQIVQECIMLSIRESIPTEEIIRAYMDETMEQEEEVIIENIEEEAAAQPPPTPTTAAAKNPMESPPAIVPAIQNIDDNPVVTQLTFNDIDSVLEGDNQVIEVEAPKTIERLEEISTSRALQRKLEEAAEEDDDDYDDRGRLQIMDQPIDLTGFDILDEPVKRESHGLVQNDFDLNFEELS